ncbi:hypothetical protein Tco_0057632, partial [Tanacetum coccineum]
FLQQLQPEWSRFVTLVKQKEELDTVLYHKLFDILKQYQKEANEIRAEKIARNANPLVLVIATQQYLDLIIKHQNLKDYMYLHQNNILPLDLMFLPDIKNYKPTNNNLRTSSNSRNKNVDTTLRYVNENQTGQFSNQRTVTIAGARDTVGSQRTKDYTYHKEKMLLCKQAEKGVPLQAEQVDWLEDTNEEVDEQ